MKAALQNTNTCFMYIGTALCDDEADLYVSCYVNSCCLLHSELFCLTFFLTHFFALMQFPLHVQFIHLSVGVRLLITITTIGVAHVC